MAPLRWGIKGLGAISDDFVHSLECVSAENHKVVAVCSSDAKRAQGFVDRLKRATGAAIYTNADEFFADANIDVVYVGSLNTDHHNDVIQAINAGKHVLCEKPMGTNLAQVQEMVDLARSKKVFFMEAFWTRFFPAVFNLRKHLENETIGRIDTLNANFYLGGLEESTIPRLVKPELGGSALMDIGCYLVMFAQTVMKHRPTDIHVVAGKRFSTGVDSCASVVLKYADESLANLSYSVNSSAPNEVIIMGSKGYIKLNNIFHAPTHMEVHLRRTDTGGVIAFEMIESTDYPVPSTDRPFIFTNSSGLSYEAEAVRDALLSGKSEHELMTLDDSLNISYILEEVRNRLYNRSNVTLANQ